MQKLNILFRDPKTRKIFIVFGISVLILFLFFQQKKMKKQMQLKVEYIEQKNMLRDELDDII